jgi:hypothetical protein
LSAPGAFIPKYSEFRLGLVENPDTNQASDDKLLTFILVDANESSCYILRGGWRKAQAVSFPPGLGLLLQAGRLVMNFGLKSIALPAIPLLNCTGQFQQKPNRLSAKVSLKRDKDLGIRNKTGAAAVLMSMSTSNEGAGEFLPFRAQVDKCRMGMKRQKKAEHGGQRCSRAKKPSFCTITTTSDSSRRSWGSLGSSTAQWSITAFREHVAGGCRSGSDSLSLDCHRRQRNDAPPQPPSFGSCSARPAVTIRPQLGQLEGAAGRSATHGKRETALLRAGSLEIPMEAPSLSW